MSIVLENPQSATATEQPAVIESLVDAKGQHVILFEDFVACMVGDEKSDILKRISYEDFSTIIGTILNQRNEGKLEGFHLPNNCYYYAKSGTSINLSCYYPESEATLSYGSHKYLVRMPNLIISHTLIKHANNWQHAGARYFATDAKVGNLPKKFVNEVSPRDRIFTSPFPNTYSEGNMCYGSNAMPIMFSENNLRGLQWYYQFLFESPFNGDLGIRGITSEPSISGWFETLAKAVKDKTAFPYDKLRGYTKVG